MPVGFAYCRMIFDADAKPVDFEYLEANDAFGRLTGLSDVEGKLISQVIPGILDLVPEHFEVCGRVALTSQPGELDVTVTSLGSPLHVLLSQPKPGHFLATFTDVAERVRVEKTLSAREDMYRYAFERSAAPRSITSGKGDIRVNDAFCEMFGYECGELMDRTTWMTITHPEDVADSQAHIDVLLAGKSDTSRFEKRFVRKDGTSYDVEINVQYRPENGGRMVTFIQDITERKRTQDEILCLYSELEERVQERPEELTAMNEELISANVLLEDATRAKSDFLASMSHELRTPLNSIIGFTGVMLEGLAGPMNEEQRLQLGMVSGSGKHLLSIIDGILDLSKIESGIIVAAVEEFNVSTVVESCMAMIRPLADSKGIRLELTREPNTDLLESDPRLISQILINLLGNAVKFTSDGYVALNVSAESAQMIFSVTDTGCGISPADLSHVMESFYQAEPVLKAKNEGTGLGLAISARLAGLLGGELEAESELGVGSKFTLRVPR
jgi:PAS domain S-box-containing protein